MSNPKLNCKDKCFIINNKHNNISTKMLQSAMLKLRKNIDYSNSRIDSIYNTILSLDSESNKELLITYRIDTYRKYIYNLRNIPKNAYYRIIDMFSSLIQNLSPQERKIVFSIPDDPLPYSIPEEFYEYYKVFLDTDNKFFYIKELKMNTVFKKNVYYYFDLSHYTNRNHKFSLSKENLSGISIEEPYILYSDVLPGTINSFMILFIPNNNINKLYYIFNNDTKLSIEKRYEYGSGNVQRGGISIIGNLKIQNYDVEDEFLDLNVYIKLPKDTNNKTNFYISDFFNQVTYNKIIHFSSDNINNINNVKISKYKLGIGTYTINVSQEDNAFTLLNISGQEESISITGTSKQGIIYKTRNDNTKFSQGEVVSLYDNVSFYYGEVKINVTNPFRPLDIFTFKWGYLNGESLINYSNEGEFINNIIDTISYENVSSIPLQTTNQININTNMISFNNVSHNVSDYNVSNNIYTIFNIPENNPITFLNSSSLNITQISKLRQNTYYALGPDNYTKYRYYSGTITLNIKENIDYITIYPYDGKILNGNNLIRHINSNPDNKNVSYNNVNYVSLVLTLTDTDIPFKFFNNIYRKYIRFNNIVDIGNYNVNQTIRYNVHQGIYFFNLHNRRVRINHVQNYSGISVIGNRKIIGGYYYFEEIMTFYVYSNFKHVIIDVYNNEYNNNYLEKRISFFFENS